MQIKAYVVQCTAILAAVLGFSDIELTSRIDDVAKSLLPLFFAVVNHWLACEDFICSTSLPIYTLSFIIVTSWPLHVVKQKGKTFYLVVWVYWVSCLLDMFVFIMIFLSFCWTLQRQLWLPQKLASPCPQRKHLQHKTAVFHKVFPTTGCQVKN